MYIHRNRNVIMEHTYAREHALLYVHIHFAEGGCLGLSLFSKIFWCEINMKLSTVTEWYLEKAHHIKVLKTGCNSH